MAGGKATVTANTQALAAGNSIMGEPRGGGARGVGRGSLVAVRSGASRRRTYVPRAKTGTWLVAASETRARVAPSTRARSTPSPPGRRARSSPVRGPRRRRSIDSEAPDGSPNTYNGTLHIEGRPAVPLTVVNMLLRSLVGC